MTYVEDGFGSVWPPCEKHGCALQVVRPGSARCVACENETYLSKRAEAAEERVKELEQADETRVRDICRLTEERDTLESSLAQAREALRLIVERDVKVEMEMHLFRQGFAWEPPTAQEIEARINAAIADWLTMARPVLAGDSGKG